TLPCVCSESCWPSLPVNSSCRATVPRRPPRARSRSFRWASEILPAVTAPSPTRTARRSQAWETGFAKTTCVSRAIAFLVGETGPYRTKIGALPGPPRRLHSARCADTVRSPLQADGRAVDDKLQEIEHKFERLEADLGDPGVLLEVRAGAGGDEAGLFASQVLRMYLRYAERKGWRFTVVDSSENAAGGIKDATVTISGDGIYSSLKYESGVHRVQRVPATE